METLRFRFEDGCVSLARPSVLVGVVSSGNLEVLIEVVPLNDACEIEISTPVRGFNDTWKAVIDDFHQRWQLRNTRVSINDMGATPAVVSLRLDQAVEAINRINVVEPNS